MSLAGRSLVPLHGLNSLRPDLWESYALLGSELQDKLDKLVCTQGNVNAFTAYTRKYQQLQMRVQGSGFGAWAPIGKSLTRIYPVQSERSGEYGTGAQRAE